MSIYEIKEQKLDNLINEINTKIKYIIDSRNKKLVNILSGSLKSDLEISIKNNYLDRFYYECKL